MQSRILRTSVKQSYLSTHPIRHFNGSNPVGSVVHRSNPSIHISDTYRKTPREFIAWSFIGTYVIFECCRLVRQNGY